MKSDLIGPLNVNYNEIPFFQQQWFLILSIILFPPALIFIGFSGNIYTLKDCEVYKFKSPNIFGLFGIITSVLIYFILFH
jgi:hypothetical protein